MTQQQVIEIMRYPAREQSDCVHILRLEQGGFETATFADVPIVRNEMSDSTGRIPYGRDGLLHNE